VQLEKAYVQTGKMRYAIIDFPLESLHGSAFHAAEMVRCAGEQGKYWEMRDRLFANPQAIAQTAAHAAAVGLDGRRFDACLAEPKTAENVRRDMAQAQAMGVSGTPTFILAVPDAASGRLKAVRMLTGAQPFGSFKAIIDAVLGGAK
jgi:protein-disulfide isomerase